MPLPRHRLWVRVWLAMVRACTLASVLAGGCSAADDFGAFRFVDDGGARDAMPADLAGATVGDPCPAGSCSGGLSCFTTVGNASFPGGVCSSACGGSPTGCPTGSSCGQVEGTSLCLPACNPTAGVGCRADWSCCDGQRVVVGPGSCAPSNSNFCGH